MVGMAAAGLRDPVLECGDEELLRAEDFGGGKGGGGRVCFKPCPNDKGVGGSSGSKTRRAEDQSERRCWRNSNHTRGEIRRA